jgi:hypothetical protein
MCTIFRKLEIIPAPNRPSTYITNLQLKSYKKVKISGGSAANRPSTIILKQLKRYKKVRFQVGQL